MAYSTLPTQSAGGTASAAGWANIVKADLESMMHLVVRKTSDQTVSSTTLTAMTTLVLPVAANEVWRFEFMLLGDVSQASDWAIRFTFPTAGTVMATCSEVTDTGTYSGQQNFYDTTSPGGNINCAGHTPDVIPVMIWGTYINGANAGNVGLEYALATAAGGSAVVKTHSTLWAVKLA